MRRLTNSQNAHLDTARKNSFEAIATEYDKYRPGYPAKLFDFLAEKIPLQSGSSILEIGCGSGQATMGFAKRHLNMIAIDISPALLNLAKQKFHDSGIKFLLTKFEDFEAADASFDLVFAATSFHWIELEYGCRKARKLLRPNGVFAPFWNGNALVLGALKTKLDKVYSHHFEKCEPQDVMEKNSEIVSLENTDKLKKLGLFSEVEVHKFDYQTSYDTDHFIGLTCTQSQHAILPPAKLQELKTDIARVINDAGSKIEVVYKVRMTFCRA